MAFWSLDETELPLGSCVFKIEEILFDFLFSDIKGKSAPVVVALRLGIFLWILSMHQCCPKSPWYGLWNWRLSRKRWT
jgi:hypothetical protein